METEEKNGRLKQVVYLVANMDDVMVEKVDIFIAGIEVGERLRASMRIKKNE